MLVDCPITDMDMDTICEAMCMGMEGRKLTRAQTNVIGIDRGGSSNRDRKTSGGDKPHRDQEADETSFHLKTLLQSINGIGSLRKPSTV